jgi:hypothetical protein
VLATLGSVAGGVVEASPFDGVEFSSNGDEWLDELDVVDGNTELRWWDGAEDYLRAPYRGTSRSARYRDKDAEALRVAAAKGCGRIDDYFKPVPPSDDPGPEATAAPAVAAAVIAPPVAAAAAPARARDYWDDDNGEALSVDECIELMDKRRLGTPTGNRKYFVKDEYDKIRYLQVYKYLVLRRGTDSVCEPLGKMAASLQASTMFSATPKDYLARCIRVWADYFAVWQELPKRRQGAHAKVVSFIADADNANSLRTLLRSMPRNTRTAETFAARVHERFPQLSISPRTASDWMHRLGFHPGGLHSTVYKDGHERPDIIYERRVFIDTMTALYPRMFTYSGPELLTVTPPVAQVQGAVLWAVHDESICESSGGRLSPWIEEGHPPMQPKRGESVMISGFLTPYGMSTEDYVTFDPGKNKDGYWCNRHLVGQLDTWLVSASKRFPNTTIVVQFDNSRNHGAYAPDALVASRLNLSDGYPEMNASDKAAGLKPEPFRDTTWTDAAGVTHTQSFLYTDGTMDAKDPTRPAHKGIKSILMERGLWRDTHDAPQTISLPATVPLPSWAHLVQRVSL